MTRNWKALAKQAADMEDGSSLLLSNPDFLLDTLPEGAQDYHYDDPVVGGETIPTTKEIRSFLWENRKSRRLTRDRATLWREGNTYGIGVVTTDRALTRMNNGEAK